MRGVGPKAAAQLLTSFKTMDGVYEHIDEVKGALKQKLLDGKESAYASKHLATIRMDVPLKFDFDHCRLHMPKIKELGQFLYEMEFKEMIGRLPKILSRFNESGEAPEIPESVMALAGTASSGAMGSGSGVGGKLSSTAAKVARAALRLGR